MSPIDAPATLPALTLVLGGARSGKSRCAEALVTGGGPGPWHYVATAQALDDEMRARIARHREERAGAGAWRTVEAPVELAAALDGLPGDAAVLVDCLTLWLTNLILAEHDLPGAFAALEAALARRRGPTVLVANEVGLGIVPDNALARRFRDEAGRLNQRLAARAGRVFFVVAGIPVVVKGAAGPIA
ncbi:bifunctional adenosylcobinamide kinase/adenosylcobinamide-phosphate guanylyltransferase [Zavarzinia compransoris]|uniref:bifunctional adenosylcobinamide kinase/adenosylcobinamide-phosphate guanylyltransferase n=1 Tax=Zavarzinia marina TaxID=2911065 RepID=UPI001F4147EB|nr:bifunctional adenosylcobinamide kinase/adenosylcobinamide-phosphate guanylyltransferase [Zavarzinia marina]MCF4164764.1 bifunctional adenosylcobinamide kinase/adenosylcobinamide-phosphate guanylyltransferase [Zavarzinia marina]